jgi:hypothetical protein
MKVSVSNFVSKTSQATMKKSTKTFKEDETLAHSFKQKEQEKEVSLNKNKRFGIKSIRKTLRKLCDEYPKEEMDLMIWEVDENLDGYITEHEFVNMYKRCIEDPNEQEPKKLFYLVQFLMYDKDEKRHIIIEDTLDILCARCLNPTTDLNPAIDRIFEYTHIIINKFSIEEVDQKGNVKPTGKKMERMTYLEYAERMHVLSLRTRFKIMNKKKIHCKELKEKHLQELKKSK